MIMIHCRNQHEHTFVFHCVRHLTLDHPLKCVACTLKQVIRLLNFKKVLQAAELFFKFDNQTIFLSV